MNPKKISSRPAPGSISLMILLSGASARSRPARISAPLRRSRPAAVLVAGKLRPVDRPRRQDAQFFSGVRLSAISPVEHIETAAEALAVSLNETGEIHWPRMEQLTGRTPRKLQKSWSRLVYRNPEAAAGRPADRYLSGNVRAKLVDGHGGGGNRSVLPAQYRSLKAVQPPDLEPGDIEARLGSSWIPANGYPRFRRPVTRMSPCPMCMWPTRKPSPHGRLRLDYTARNGT